MTEPGSVPGENGSQPDSRVRRRAMATVVAFGVVSLLADIVYEGARSILGPYLAALGATAAVVGLVSGAGEFVGYALRWVTGVMADRTRGYWPMTFAGYGLTVLAVPLLGWVGRVDLALALVVAERLGKAVRSPARDALLSEVAAPLGRGWGFGIHEALDQTGAVAGPLLLAGLLAIRQGDYRLALTVLAIPGALAMVALVFARRTAGHWMAQLGGEESVAPAPAADENDAGARTYFGFVFLSALGFAPFPLIAFHVTGRGLATDPEIPLMFAVAMAVDAASALLSGRFYDRRGLRVLLVLPVLSALTALAFSSLPWLVWVAVAIWGAVMGIQESSLRAAVADLSSSGRRATSYGFFNASYGMALLGGGALLGFLYGISVPVLMTVVVATQVAAGLMLRLLLASP